VRCIEKLSPITRTVKDAEHAHLVGGLADGMRKQFTSIPHVNFAISLDSLHSDYDVWCRGESLEAIPVDAFTEEFDRLREIPELSGNIQKIGNRYYGIKLRNSKVARLPMPRRDAG
jgi:hypothetical protein